LIVNRPPLANVLAEATASDPAHGSWTQIPGAARGSPLGLVYF
jgi:hypothetical protein